MDKSVIEELYNDPEFPAFLSVLNRLAQTMRDQGVWMFNLEDDFRSYDFGVMLHTPIPMGESIN